MFQKLKKKLNDFLLNFFKSLIKTHNSRILISSNLSSQFRAIIPSKKQTNKQKEVSKQSQKFLK